MSLILYQRQAQKTILQSALRCAEMDVGGLFHTFAPISKPTASVAEKKRGL